MKPHQRKCLETSSYPVNNWNSYTNEVHWNQSCCFHFSIGGYHQGKCMGIFRPAHAGWTKLVSLPNTQNMNFSHHTSSTQYGNVAQPWSFHQPKQNLG